MLAPAGSVGVSHRRAICVKMPGRSTLAAPPPPKHREPSDACLTFPDPPMLKDVPMTLPLLRAQFINCKQLSPTHGGQAQPS
jgi:hypothetical protein